MNLLADLVIDTESRIPKYKQIVDLIILDISKGNLKIGQKIPSINEISEECYLSRDTVEKAYSELKERKIIVSVKGKGFYVAKTDLISRVNVLFFLNKLSSYKMRIYNSFVNYMGTNAQIDLQVHHCDEKIFLRILEKNMGNYDYFAIMPHFKNENQEHLGGSMEVIDAIERIPKEKLILMDYYLPKVKGDYAAVYQDFESDIYDVLFEGINNLKKYNKLILVYPDKGVYPYPKEIKQGFKRFCLAQSFDYEVLDQIYEDMELLRGDAYIIIEEMDLVNLVRQTKDKAFKLGEDLGVISYNDTPLKELLEITVISTDFKVMGDTAAYMILKNKCEKIKNAFKLINRNSI